MSRESIIWDEHTREYIKGIIASAKDEAEEIIQKQLSETHFFRWIKKATEVISGLGSYYGSNGALRTLSNLVDKSKISPQFGKSKIKYHSDPSKTFKGLRFRVVSSKIKRYGEKPEITRNILDLWHDFSLENMYFLPEGTSHSPIKDRYLCEASGNSKSFITYKVYTDEELKDLIDKEYDKSTPEAKKRLLKEYTKNRDDLIELFKSYPEFSPKDYSQITVPESFEKEVQKEEEEETKASLTPAQLRELHGKIVCSSFKKDTKSWTDTSYLLNKVEPTLKEIQDEKTTVIFGTQEDDETLKFVTSFIFRGLRSYEDTYNKPQAFKGQPYKLARFSKRNIKHIKNNENYIRVDKFLYKETGTTFQIGSAFKAYFTARYLTEKLNKCNFLLNFKEFSEPLTEAYKTLKTYHQNSGAEALTMDALYNGSAKLDFFDKAEKGIKLQTFLANNEDLSKKDKAEKALEIFGHNKYENADVLDMPVVNLVEELFSFCEPLSPVLGELSYLKRENSYISSEASELILAMIDHKNLNNFTLSEEAIKTIQTIS